MNTHNYGQNHLYVLKLQYSMMYGSLWFTTVVFVRFIYMRKQVALGDILR